MAPSQASALSPAPGRLQRCADHSCPEGGCDQEDTWLHRTAAGTAPGQVPSSVVDVLRAPGSPLPASVRAPMERRLGHDFGHVRIHADNTAAESARAVHARAYTVSDHVVFNAGQYQPESEQGQRLLTHELAHVIQQRGQRWSTGSLRISEPTDPDEREAERVSSGAQDRIGAGTGADVLLHRVWNPAQPQDCSAQPADVWLQKVVVDQEKAQSATMHWSNGTVTASICSTGKGHCCVDSADPDATAASVTESRRHGSNATPIGSDFVITGREREHNGWDFWNTFDPNRWIALHQHHTVTGTPLSHGCVRLPVETAQAIFCGARERVTRVEVRGFARPDCAEPDLQKEWRGDFESAAATVTDGESPRNARIIRENRAETRRALTEAYGHRLSEDEIGRGKEGTLAIPRCRHRGAAPTTEEHRAVPEVGAAANVPSTSSELLAGSGLERFVSAIALALVGARRLSTAEGTVDRLGRELWTAATAATRTTQASDGDDRPLYWARLQMTRTIRQWQPRFRLTDAQREGLIETFDRASRGMSTADFTGPAAGKRLVISGFDPFGLDDPHYGLTRATNPSGAAALALDGRTLTNGTIQGTVQSVVFPVSFAAFDAGTVERFFRPYLSGPQPADMIMTISMGGRNEFELEEWAGRTRGAGIPDNREFTPAVAGPPPGLAAGPQFIRATLPPATRAPLGQTRPTEHEAEIYEIPAGQQTTVRSTTGPTPGSTAVAGSGGSYLSNEIFYRVGLLQLQEGSTIPFGHLHVPFLSPGRRDFATQRQQIVQRVEQTLTAALPAL
ncbi:MAG: eCIS core domain-containing protein [Pseudonocardiaceae bacterium]